MTVAAGPSPEYPPMRWGEAQDFTVQARFRILNFVNLPVHVAVRN